MLRFDDGFTTWILVNSIQYKTVLVLIENKNYHFEFGDSSDVFTSIGSFGERSFPKLVPKGHQSVFSDLTWKILSRRVPDSIGG